MNGLRLKGGQASIWYKRLDIPNHSHMTRQRERRAAFARANESLVRQYGFNLPRRVRRKIARDTWRAA